MVEEVLNLFPVRRNYDVTETVITKLLAEGDVDIKVCRPLGPGEPLQSLPVFKLGEILRPVI
jgi:hypothetical protein